MENVLSIAWPVSPMQYCGYEFSLRKSGLWLAPQLTLGFWGYSTLMTDDAIAELKAAMTVALIGGPSRKPMSLVPPTASPLWEHPETVVGEIIAYRGWHYDVRILANGPSVLLRSKHQDFVWDGPVATSDEVPEADGNQGLDHGLHAVGLEPHHKTNFDAYIGDAVVWGRVALSGIVVEGAYGYRAERATIQELWVNPNGEDWDEGDSPEGLCLILGDRYQCDASVRVPSWKDLVASMPKARD